MKIKKRKLSGISSGIVLSLCLSFLLFIYAPYDLFLANLSDFALKPGNLLFPAMVLFILCFVGLCAVFIIARLINEKLYGVGLAVGFALLVSFYIQGNFLVKNLPPMDGTEIDWNAYPKERLASIIAFSAPLVVMLILLLIFRTKLMKKITLIGSTCLFLLFAVTLTTVFLTTDTNKPETLAATTKDEFVLSEDKNFIMLILDATDSNYMLEAMERDEEFSEMLDGFTYYDNALSTYPFTLHSIPMMFSGEWYDYKSNFEEYRTKAFYDSPFLNKLTEEDYRIGWYDPDDLGLLTDLFNNRFENFTVSTLDYTNHSAYTLIFKMSMVKFGPWDIKKGSWKVSKQAKAIRVPANHTDLFDWDNLDFYNQIKESDAFTLTDDKCARIIHIEGAHVPLQYDKNLNIIENATYADHLDACVTMLKAYVSRLKESGVYDNSNIVFLADHGWSGVWATDGVNPKKRMHPFLMVKGAGESHELQYSSAPILYTDLAQGLTKLIGGAKSDEIFEYSDGDTRTRRIIVADYNNPNKREVLTDGRADDIDAMIETGTVYVLK